MRNVRLLPVVLLAISALLVLKTVGLVTNGGYVLGVTSVRAAGAPAPAEGAADTAPAGDPTLTDASPTLTDAAPTIAAPGGEGHGTPASAGSTESVAPVATMPSGENCIAVANTLNEGGELIVDDSAAPAAGAHGEPEAPADEEAASPAGPVHDCFPSGDAVPMELDAAGSAVPLTTNANGSTTQQAILATLSGRRAELETYEQDLALRASLVDAAEKRLQERQATLEALEAQISSLVDQRTEMESGQFAGIVAMYETMKPKDAANIFNALDMEVLLRVAKTMSPRKMAPILAEMQPTRAQELTVSMAALADRPATDMTQADLDALPQIVGQ